MPLLCADYFKCKVIASFNEFQSEAWERRPIMSAPITYSRADTTQLARLGQLGAELFVDTFGHLYSDEDLQAYLAKVYSVEGLKSDLDSGRVIWVAEQGDQWIGYCKMGPFGLPFDTAGRRAVELKQMYVRREYQGQGVADGLMQIFLEWAASQDAEDLYISCWSENHRALAFYARHGFQTVGAYTFWVGNHGDDERILKRTIRS